MATGKNKKKATTTKRDRKLGKDGRAEVDRLYAANPLMTEEEKKEEWKNNPLFKAAGKTLLAFEVWFQMRISIAMNICWCVKLGGLVGVWLSQRGPRRRRR